MIDGVEVRELKRISDNRGFLIELFRQSWFGAVKQVYCTTLKVGVIKDQTSFHMHNLQKDYMTCLVGKAKLVMVDIRMDSPTRNEIMEVEMGEGSYKIVSIPPKVLHALQNIGDSEAFVINCIDREYSGDDEIRVPNKYYKW